MFKLLTIICLSSFVSRAYSQENTTHNPEYREVAETLTYAEKNVRNAAVKVISSDGHGSGTYVTIDGYHMVLTAAHVVTEEIGTQYYIQDGERLSVGTLAFKNEELDVAAIHTERLLNRSPIKLKKTDAIPEIGTHVTYSGYPSSFDLLTFRGSVVGYEVSLTGRKIILIHSYAWFGCSGSGVYDAKGKLIGILWGVTRENAYGPTIVEDIAWVTPFYYIDKQQIIEGILSLKSHEHKKAN